MSDFAKIVRASDGEQVLFYKGQDDEGRPTLFQRSPAMSDSTPLPPLPKVGPIGYASVVDVQSYAPWLKIGPHLPGVRDVALWTTDQMRAYAREALSAYTAEQMQERDRQIAEQVVRACAEIVEAQTARARKLYAAMNAEPVAACQHAAAILALIPVKEPKE